ncbi:MAG: hypothetical protein MUD12_06320 [Spirochaetes bacterium]|jgi:hypothetical protein|nr:hypothetical protein [Spirochaetota bacterium]
MKRVINETVMPLINEGLLSVSKLHDLIYIKEFIDRVSTRMYIEPESADEIGKKYGVKPRVVSWGDYFQTELATSLHHVSDDEFRRAVSTIKFDIISSYIIFSEKDSPFFEWVEDNWNAVAASGASDFDDDEQDIIHLKILMDYYVNMGIINGFTASELEWYGGFEESMAM